MTRARLNCVFSVICLLAATACNRSGKKVIGVISKGQAHEYWQSIHAGAIAAANELNVAIQWNGPASEADIVRQGQILDSMIAQHLEGIALAPVERRALVPYVERARAANIPILIYDSGIDTNEYVSFVATNNYKAGELAARKLGQLLNGNGKVLEIRHMPGSASSTEREQAFSDVIAREFPGIQIAGEQFGMGDRDKVLAVTENLLTAHPDVDGIFASAESSSAGAVLGVKERGLAGKIKFVGFDSSPDLIDALNDGTISALVVQDPFRIGYVAVKTLADKLAGRQVANRIDLDAILITKQDLGRPEIHAMLFPDLKKYLGQ